ncbi:hypothetical protein [Microbacterium proteolyticum]|uniref:hypothetical protein n=1 Tax=Microbacterium proteolyticum TaxID=1572644 RepID=UPI0035C24248
MQEAAAVPIIFAVATAIAWLRLPGTARGTFWAEDAQVFSARALGQSPTPWGVLSSYDGYVHALPQTVANVIWATVPVAHTAVAFTATACAIAGVVAALVFALSGSWVRSRAARILLATVTVCTPGLPYETLGNLANLHWYLLWLAPFLFLFRPRAWWTAALAAAGGLLILTTEIQAIVFAPLLLLHLRDRKRWPLIAGVTVGIAVQGLAVLGGGRTTGTGLPLMWSVVQGYLLQVPLLAATGSGEAASTAVGWNGWPLAWAALLPFVASAAAVVYLCRRSIAAVAAIYLLGASVVIWSAGYALNRSSAFDFSAADTGVLLGGVPLLRYSVVPVMLLLGVVIVMFDALVDRHEGTAAALTAATLLAVFVAGFTTHVVSPRSLGPTWQEGIQTAEGECAQGGQGVVSIRTAPLYGEWHLPLPCDRIDVAVSR